ncbi:MAG TPA: T9SS type A sorting domain-containing protein, partial [Candidatus Cloacimonadota bacterium]|nr:T9SS type A sorting domain-containing protein [Candidatus Cloacimonadota bacterium]
RIGISSPIPYGYRQATMLGDSLALYDYVISGNSVIIKRGIVTPSATVLPLEEIFSFTAPTDWGSFSAYPLSFMSKNGKLHSAFLTPTKILVLFTDADSTIQHVFDRGGINVASFLIVDEELGWCSHSGYPDGGTPKIYQVDFTTDTLQLFYESPAGDTGYHQIHELAGGYFLMTVEPGSDLPDLLVQGTQIINVYPEHWVHWIPYYFISGFRQITDELSYVNISDGLDRDQSWNVVTWVEGNDLLMTGIPNGNGNPYAYGYIHGFIPNTATSFSSVYGIGMSYPPCTREPAVFKNWQLTDGVLQDMGGWPDLPSYQGAVELIRMNPDFGVAISQIDDGLHNFSLIEYPSLSIRNYQFVVSNFTRSAYSSHRFYLVDYDGRVHSFVLELGSPNIDELVSPVTTSLSFSPNPFRGACSIMIKSDKAAPVKLSVYNLRGQLVELLHQERLISGSHSIRWDASAYPSGVYFLRLQSGKEVITRKLLLQK